MPGTMYVSSGGQTGSILTIVSSGTGTITVSNTTLGKSYSKSVTAGDSVVFKGLKTGTWTVKLTNGTQTSTKTVVITSDYSTNIAYFSASINITYPANSTCTVKNSSGQTVASNSNTTSSTKTWTAVVNAKDTYTIIATATDGSGKSKSKTVEISADGQSVSATLSYALVVFDGTNGGDNTSETGGWTKITDSSAIKITVTETEISFLSGTNGTKRLAGTVKSIDFTSYSTLYIEGVYNANVQSDNYACRLLSKRDTSSSSEVGLRRLPHGTKDVVSIDLTAIEPRSAIWVALSNSSASNPSIVYRCWAE